MIMTPWYEDLYGAGTVICGVMIVVLILKIRTRGKSAYVMALAFLVMGLLLQGLKMQWSSLVTNFLGIVLGLLLVYDFLFRAVEQSKKHDDRS